MKDIVFPENLYADIRIEENYNFWFNLQNDSMESDGDASELGAMIRVFDGKLWYTASTNDVAHIQEELDRLAVLAQPNPQINAHPEVARYQVHRDEVLHFQGDRCARNVSREAWMQLIEDYRKVAIKEQIPELNLWGIGISGFYTKKTFLSSKGAKIVQDMQSIRLSVYFGFTVNGVTNYDQMNVQKPYFEDLLGHEEEVRFCRARGLDFAKNAVDVEPGEYTVVLAPIVTAMFTHECFGHKSESDFMLNDQTLREEWIMGKQVGMEQISICDDGSLFQHGYLPYDDEGTKAEPTWLVTNGVLTGRLHDVHSAEALKEALTGNSRAQSYECEPIVRMTNTYMQGGQSDPEEMLRGIEDGIYIDDVASGTGQSTFTMRPIISHRIRNGRICEPLRVNVITGSVFKALFDIDMLGNDFELFDCYYCGKGGQMVNVSAGGPSIRVKSMTVN